MSSTGAEAQLCSQPAGCDITDLASRKAFKSADAEEEATDATYNRGAFDSEHLEKFLQAVAAVGDTRLVPMRPVTPFTASTGESAELLEEEEDEELTPSTALHRDVVSVICPTLLINLNATNKEFTEQFKKMLIFSSISRTTFLAGKRNVCLPVVTIRDWRSHNKFKTQQRWSSGERTSDD